MKGIFYIHYNAPGDNDGAWVFGSDGDIDTAFAALAVGDSYQGGILKYAAKWMDVVTTADGLNKLTGQQEATLGAAYGEVGPTYTNQTLSGGGTPDNPLILASQGASDQQVLKWNATLSVWEPATDTAGSGDVVGPASSTDNAAARFNLATGKLIQNSVVIIGDTGAVTGVTDLTPTGVVTVPNEGLHILDTNASHDLVVKAGSDLTADRIFTITTGDAAVGLDLTGGTLTTSAPATVGGTNTGDQFTAQAADSLVGRGNGGGAGAAETITLDATLAMTGTVLSVVGTTASKAVYGGGTSAADINKDKYYPPNGNSGATLAAAPTELQANAIIPFAGTLRNLFLKSGSAAAGVGEIFTVFINGVASTLTATIAAAATTASDTTHFPAVVAGDLITVYYDVASDGNITGAAWGFELRAS